MQAVQHGLFKPLGEGDVAIADVIGLLEREGYQGWYVIEQDQALTSIPALGSGPVRDVRKSVTYLRALSERL
jgi:inosose dehydratase